ncbi:MAG: ABC transporter substrate-binding protein [Deltaproteobacteria bacterium]|nr:ABC transporter substrate-binding protein [Deltaproteobacteria bacterium]
MYATSLEMGVAMKVRANRLIGLSIVLGVLHIAPVSNAAEKLDKVRFTYAPLSASGFLWFVAKDAGYFEKNRLDVEMYFEGASPIMVQSLLAGENQLAGGLGPTVVTNVLQSGDVIAVACIVHTFTTPMYVQPSITSLQQLRGKKVGVSRIGAVSHLTADSILRRARVGDVTIIQTGGIPESMAAMMTGNVDGAMVNPPNNIILREKGYREIVGAQQLKEMNLRFPENGLMAKRTWAERNSDVVKRFIKSIAEGLRRLHDDKEFAIKTLSKYTKVTDAKSLDESYRWAMESFFKDFKTPPDALQMMIDQLASSRLVDPNLAQKTRLKAFYENRYVEELENEGFFKKLWQ